MLGWRSRATASASIRNRSRSSDCACLPLEDHLQGDEPVQRTVPGLVDDAHAAAPENIEQLVPGDFREIGRPLGLR